MAQLTSRSTLYVPLSVGGGWEQAASGVMDYDRNVLHHKYCMLGLAIDSMTLPFRKVSRSQFEFSRVCTTVANGNARRNVASLSLVCPLRGQINVYEQSKSNSLSNNMIGMKLTAKNVYINGDYGRVERYGSKRTDGQNSTINFDQYLSNALPVHQWGDDHNALSLSPECVITEEKQQLQNADADEGLRLKQRQPLTYGMMGSVRGIMDMDYPAPSCELLLLKHLSQTRCDPRRVVGFANTCPTIVPGRFYPRDATMLRDDTSLNVKSGVIESKQVDGLESKPEGNGEEENAHERFLSNITVLRSSTDLVPMLQGTLAGLKNRPQKVMFEYVKGPGLTNDDIVELEQNLFQIVEAYMED